MKPFRVGRKVTNPINSKASEIVHVTDKGVYLRDNDTPAESDAVDFIPAERTSGMKHTIDDIK